MPRSTDLGLRVPNYSQESFVGESKIFSRKLKVILKILKILIFPFQCLLLNRMGCALPAPLLYRQAILRTGERP